jgi:hypothetical protein
MYPTGEGWLYIGTAGYHIRAAMILERDPIEKKQRAIGATELCDHPQTSTSTWHTPLRILLFLSRIAFFNWRHKASKTWELSGSTQSS